METKRLSFYTEGEGFTDLLRSFIEEGKNFTVYQILRDGGFTDSLSNRFFRGELKFTGTTQFGEDLGVEEDTIDSTALLKQSLRSILSRLSGVEYAEVHPTDFIADFPALLNKFINDADIRILKNAFGEDALFKCYRTDELNDYSIELINNEGYGVIKKDNIKGFNTEILDGLILPSGDIITCGYQEHSSLYPFLKSLGLVKVSCWTNCEETIHISSGSISGTIAHAVGSRYSHEPTEAQLETLFELRRDLGTYGYEDNISIKLLHDCEEVEDFGGKWNNLSYVKKFYKDIKTPRISKEPIEGVKNCLRTSPRYSLPGLLESVFDITENSVNEINETFEKFKDIRRDNKLNIFYQEFLEGLNGVLHYDRYGLRYDISSNRGDIVQGVKGNTDISDDIKNQLEKIGNDFYTDFDKPVQIEFVIKDNEVWLVQLRVLENNAEETVRLIKPDETLVTGKTFSKGCIEEIDVDKILILDSDGDSELLLGKEALIVKGDVEFSHILALSKALRIPSIYATGDFELPKGKVKFTAYNKEAWITKTDE